MKVSEDRRTKAGVLSLALQRYENSPKFSQDEVPQELQLEFLKKYQRKGEGSLDKRARSKDKSQKSGEKPNPSDLQQTQQDIFAMCNSLSSRIQTLKKQKYEHVVQQYEQEQRIKLAIVLQAETKKTAEKYGGMRKQLSLSHEQQKLKIIKALDDVKKFKQAYKTMLDELEQKKSKINSEYQNSLSSLKDQKQKLIAEWKRHSNEELFKLGLKNQ